MDFTPHICDAKAAGSDSRKIHGVLVVDPLSAMPFEPTRPPEPPLPPEPWITPWAWEVINRWGPPAFTAMAHLASATAHLATWYYG